MSNFLERELEIVYQMKSLEMIEQQEFLRWAYVHVVGAWDCFVHRLIIENFTKFLNQDISIKLNRNVDIKINNVDLNVFLRFVSCEEEEKFSELKLEFIESVRQALLENISRETYQKYDSIRKAFETYCGIKNIWKNHKFDGSTIKNKLDFICKRRDQIVHSSDYNPFNAEIKQDISYDDVIYASDYILKLSFYLEDVLIKDIAD